VLLSRFGQAGFVNPIHFSQQAFVYSIKETSILSACYSSINRKEVVARFAGISSLFAETESLKQVAIRTDPEIQAYYRKHAGKNSKNIIVKVAHKICCRIISVIKNETPYQINYKSTKK